MKKKLLSLISLVLATSLLVACGGAGKQNQGSEAKTTAQQQEAKGAVYYLNFKPEQDQQWKELASIYTKETGVPVTVVTAAAGEYETTLMAEMGKSEAPTLFQVNGPVGLKSWEEHCYNLEDTPVRKELTSDAFALKASNGETAGIAYVVESYGLITNKTLLEKAGHKVEDIHNFQDLKKIAEDITKRHDELGFSAFASAGMDGSSDWRFKTHLANLPLYYEYQKEGISQTAAVKGSYLNEYRQIWDLYINNSTTKPAELSAKTGDDARNEFLQQQAVFFQNGSWEYGNLVGEGKMTDQDLSMIPIYIGVEGEEKQGLCTGTENYWCVNKNSKTEDIQATIDFMYWCVTSEVGTQALCGSEKAMPSGENGMGFVIPFKKALESKNLFVQIDKQLTAEGKIPVSWNFSTMPSEEWKNGVGSALSAYAADQTDDKWQDVVKAFVEGWATEYQLAN